MAGSECPSIGEPEGKKGEINTPSAKAKGCWPAEGAVETRHSVAGLCRELSTMLVGMP